MPEAGASAAAPAPAGAGELGPPALPGQAALPAGAGLSIAAVDAHMAALGANAQHRQRVWRHWLHALPLQAGRRRIDDFLPKPLREALPALMATLQGLVRIAERQGAADGSERLLLQLADGRSAEAVLLSTERSPALCVSSQVGCAVGCRFCMTGVGGLERQLGSAEICAQLALARTLRPVHKLVFMGMGEPAHNLEAVLEAIQLLGTVGQIGHKNLVFSTVGDARAFERLMALQPGDVRPALALSLHSTDAERRAQLLPRAPRIDPAELVARADAYAQASGYPLQLQWTLLAGVNDGDDEVAGLQALLRGRRVVLNLIPWNSVPGLDFQRPDWEAAAALARRLHRAGILTKLRRSDGQDVEAGCGQLRARALQGVPVAAPRSRRASLQSR